jgi:(E)-4-hydroxy-3-methylbut-2-enyl-diphosphate synthase
MQVGIKRRRAKVVRVAGLLIGGGNPVVIQEMVTTPARDVSATVRQIRALQSIGLRLVRVAVPDSQSARALKTVRERCGIPIVADVQFDYRLALIALEAGCDKLRINPGNIGSSRKLLEVVRAAKDRGVPIRVGVNSGSLAKDVMDMYGGRTGSAMVESALKEVLLLEQRGFDDIVISLKSPDIRLTVEANREIARRVSYPLHIGITEAGFGAEGIVRSVCGLGPLLMSGIGDTVRISLTEVDRRKNVELCQRVLAELGIMWT